MKKSLYVSLETAKKLKELGYNKPCKCYYRRLLGSDEFIFSDSLSKPETNESLNKGKYKYYSAPLLEEIKDFNII